MNLTGRGSASSVPGPRVGRPGGVAPEGFESSLLVSDGGALLLDVTRHFAEQAARIERIDAVLLTHGHRDASGGLAALRRWWRQEELASPIPVYASRQTIAVLRARVARLDHCRFVATEAGQRGRARGWMLQALEVPHAPHARYRTFAWKLTRGATVVVYASDVARLTALLRHFCGGASVLVIDGAMWRRRIFSHLTIDEALPQLCDWDVEQILLTQIGRSAPAHAELARLVARTCPRARPAHDGLELML